MSRSILLLMACLICFVVPSMAYAVPQQSVCVPFNSIQALVFNKGVYTTPGRTHSIPQLECQGNCWNDHFVNSVLCQNRGSSGSTPSWECTSELPGTLSIVSPDVSCEGCHYPGDLDVRHWFLFTFLPPDWFSRFNCVHGFPDGWRCCFRRIHGSRLPCSCRSFFEAVTLLCVP